MCTGPRLRPESKLVSSSYAKMVFDSDYGTARKSDRLLWNRKVIFRRALWTGFKACDFSMSPATLVLAGTSPPSSVCQQAWVPGLKLLSTPLFSLGSFPAAPLLVFLVLLHSFLPYGVCFAALTSLAGLHARHLDLHWLPPGLTDKVTLVH